MPDMGSISAAIGGLKTAADIAKGFLDLKEAASVQGKVIELQGVILAAQSSALAAQSDQFSLLEEIRGLKQKMADLEAWNAEKQRYELKALATGIVAYSLKPSMSNGEPAHYLCANCFAAGKKSYLQQHISGPYYDEFMCRGCGDKIPVNKGTPPSSYIQPTDF